MKKCSLLIAILFMTISLYSQTIEKIGTISDLTVISGKGGGLGSPNEIAVNEAKGILKIVNNSTEYTYFSLDSLEGINKEIYRSSYSNVQIELKDFKIGYDDGIICIENKDNSIVKEIAGANKTRSGISFILKKGSGYIVYYVDQNGNPGAVDTEGKIYTSAEAMGYLKAYDSEKYAQSLARAAELGLQAKFLNNEVLVWGRTYYSNASTYKKMFGKNPYLLSSGLIQYDQDGYGYQMYFEYDSSRLCVVNQAGEREKLVVFDGFASLMKNDFSGISTSWYVGFGGNIYYYVAGSDYTEVFRIRRTWGEPDFYAMAINGYTDDDYGAYVNEVLAGMSKADLRVLRNTVFALYGYHFNSADLASHFDRQVWYTDEGKTTADITLPDHRAKLVEMIQALEAKQ